MLLKKYNISESDGVVTSESAQFGDYKGLCLKTSTSHTEIVDLTVKPNKKKKIYKFYKEVCNDLCKRSF